MAANGGSMERKMGPDADTGREGEECLPRQALSTAPVSEWHLRIVHKTDRPQGLSKTMQTRSPPRPARSFPGKAPDKSGGMLDRSIQGQIGRMLRDVFADVAEEPVPKRFIKLLEALEAQEEPRSRRPRP